MKLYQAMAQNRRLLDSKDTTHYQHALARQKRIEDVLPSGSGFDNGTKIELVTDQKIVLSTSFHHMDETGFYDGWTDHKVTVRASLMHGFTVDVSGRNKNDIKDYIADIIGRCMNEDFEWIKS